MRRGRAAVLALLAAAILLPAGIYLGAVRSLSQPGSAGEALRQVEELSETLHLFLEAHRETLEILAAAAQAGEALPDSAVQELLNSTLEKASLSDISARNGTLYLSLDNHMYTGRLYAHVTMGSGAPALPDGIETAAEQTFWTLDGGNGFYDYIEQLEDGWYAEYNCYTRG